MRTLETSKNLIIDIIDTISDRYEDLTDKQRGIATRVLKVAPTVKECLNGIEENKADCIVRLVKIVSEFEADIQPGSFGYSCMEIIQNDLKLFFKDNYGINLK